MVRVTIERMYCCGQCYRRYSDFHEADECCKIDHTVVQLPVIGRMVKRRE